MYKRSTSRSHLVQDENQTYTGSAYQKTVAADTIETAKKLNSERNIVEEYR